ncbi:glycosyltransferase [Kaistella sp. 97-N-M2]|uniref:glycosyltransferase family 2 protein n=1 Tax=Kaistella sp. 97-N-M2 TaxID=2908645 RepID=UPI001F3123B1|nr:glycosyltransferase [Kaistella sp. 97-N-M2]UJF28770.1 glycosyltransferase [Kaistella sp. 97-N-M2]
MQLSVIIPVFNTSDYLPECLESVIAQTFQDIEIICINDGSTDDSLLILKEFQKKDNRIIIIDQQNKGVSAARNSGLKIASGQYIGFVDSDDAIAPTYLQTLHEKIGDVQWSVCGYIGSEEMTFNEGVLNLNKKSLVDFIMLLKTGLLFMPWCKLYIKELITKNDLAFNSDFNYGEDLLFNIDYLRHVSSLYVSCKVLYQYNITTPNSLAKSFTVKMFNDKNFQIIEIKKFLESRFGSDEIINSYISQELYWNTYDASFFLLNNFTNLLVDERKRFIIEVMDFPFFKDCNKIKRHFLIKLFALKLRKVIYIYFLLRHQLLSVKK